jgi:hypothetical protein
VGGGGGADRQHDGDVAVPRIPRQVLLDALPQRRAEAGPEAAPSHLGACSKRETIHAAARAGIGALTFAFVDPVEAGKWAREYYEIIKSDACVPIGHTVNANIAMVTGFSCHEDEAEAKRRGMDGFRFFGYSLGHFYVYGHHQPGVTNIWDRFVEARPKLPEVGAGSGIGTPDQLALHLSKFEAAGVDQVIFIQQGGKNRHETLPTRSGSSPIESCRRSRAGGGAATPEGRGAGSVRRRGDGTQAAHGSAAPRPHPDHRATRAQYRGDGRFGGGLTQHQHAAITVPLEDPLSRVERARPAGSLRDVSSRVMHRPSSMAGGWCRPAGGGHRRWGLGLFGSSVYLHAVTEAEGWSIDLVSSVITLYYLVSALSLIVVGSAVTRFGPRPVIALGAVDMAAGSPPRSRLVRAAPGPRALDRADGGEHRRHDRRAGGRRARPSHASRGRNRRAGSVDISGRSWLTGR